ncbi:hypothetical protein JCM8115_000542 [Rhodotorula mucilaginosa]|uniref:Large ribosomal subunit protein bL32m n=1 Tax=Rhodotorula mucilaginosa TaxID=5537 RepID=A0A9P7B9G3_RHOMI|nr:hypothetical protein C6P46_005481 [Rhodotorula mucilaginosa]
MASIALPALRTARRPARQGLDAFVLRTSVASSSSSSSSSSTLAAAPLYTAFTAAFAPVLNNTAVPSALASLIPDTLAGLRELLPPWLLAAPKRRTTHGAKRMRSSNKGLKEKQNIVSCPGCGSPKLAHHLCHECHTAFRREIHREARGGNGLPTEAPPA